MKEEEVAQLFSRIRELPSEVSLEQVEAVVSGAAAGTLHATTSLSGKVFAKSLLNVKFFSIMGLLITSAISLALLFGGSTTDEPASVPVAGDGETGSVAAIEATPVDSPGTTVTKKSPPDTIKAGKSTVLIINGTPAVSTTPATVTVYNGTAYVYAGDEGAYVISTATDSAGNSTTQVDRMNCMTDDSEEPTVFAFNGGGQSFYSTCTSVCGNNYSYYESHIGDCSDKGKSKSKKRSRSSTSEGYGPQQSYFVYGRNDSTVVTTAPKHNELLPKIFINELVKDKLIGAKDESIRFQLTNKGFKLNGKTQPEAVFQKYKKLYETTAGVKVDKDFNYYYIYNGSSDDMKEDD
jgi:hypothetical protein